MHIPPHIILCGERRCRLSPKYCSKYSTLTQNLMSSCLPIHLGLGFLQLVKLWRFLRWYSSVFSQHMRRKFLSTLLYFQSKIEHHVHIWELLLLQRCWVTVTVFHRFDAPCGLRGCKNWPASFPGRMSYKTTKPGLVSVIYLIACVIWYQCLLGPLFMYY